MSNKPNIAFITGYVGNKFWGNIWQKGSTNIYHQLYSGITARTKMNIYIIKPSRNIIQPATWIKDYWK